MRSPIKVVEWNRADPWKAQRVPGHRPVSQPSSRGKPARFWSPRNVICQIRDEMGPARVLCITIQDYTRLANIPLLLVPFLTGPRRPSPASPHPARFQDSHRLASICRSQGCRHFHCLCAVRSASHVEINGKPITRRITPTSPCSKLFHLDTDPELAVFIFGPGG